MHFIEQTNETLPNIMVQILESLEQILMTGKVTSNQVIE